MITLRIIALSWHTIEALQTILGFSAMVNRSDVCTYIKSISPFSSLTIQENAIGELMKLSDSLLAIPNTPLYFLTRVFLIHQQY